MLVEYNVFISSYSACWNSILVILKNLAVKIFPVTCCLKYWKSGQEWYWEIQNSDIEKTKETFYKEIYFILTWFLVILFFMGIAYHQFQTKYSKQRQDIYYKWAVLTRKLRYLFLHFLTTIAKFCFQEIGPGTILCLHLHLKEIFRIFHGFWRS